MPSGWEATGEVRWSSRWAASTRCVNLLLASNPPCIWRGRELELAIIASWIVANGGEFRVVGRRDGARARGPCGELRV